MKKIFISFLAVLLSIFLTNFDWKMANAEQIKSWKNASLSWNIQEISDAKKLEIILDIDDSAFLYNLKLENKARKKPVISSDIWSYFIKRWICTKKWCAYWTNTAKIEEKLAMKITNQEWESLFFSNYSPKNSPNIKKFNDVSLVKDWWRLKVKVIIYLHDKSDLQTAIKFLSPQIDKNCCKKIFPWDEWYGYKNAKVNIKSIAYIYAWIEKNRLVKKAKFIKVNFEERLEKKLEKIEKELKFCKLKWLTCEE